MFREEDASKVGSLEYRVVYCHNKNIYMMPTNAKSLRGLATACGMAVSAGGTDIRIEETKGDGKWKKSKIRYKNARA